MERSGEPQFSCVNCIYVRLLTHYTSGDPITNSSGQQLKECWYDPPFRVSSITEDQRTGNDKEVIFWNRPRVIDRTYCGHYVDKDTGLTYEDIYLDWIKSREAAIKGDKGNGK